MAASDKPIPEAPDTVTTTAKFRGIEIRPLEGDETRPPPLVTHTRVTGGADALTIEAYYVPPGAIAAAYLHDELTPAMTIRGNHLVIRAELLARIALPATVANELVTQILEVVLGGAPDLRAAHAEIEARMRASADPVFLPPPDAAGPDGEPRR